MAVETAAPLVPTSGPDKMAPGPSGVNAGERVSSALDGAGSASRASRLPAAARRAAVDTASKCLGDNCLTEG